MKMRSWSRIQAILLRGAVYLSAVLTAGILICLVIYILVKGIPHLSFDLFSFTYTTENVSMFPALINICLASPILQKMYPCFRHLLILLR